MLRTKPDKLIGDRAYDSGTLDDDLRAQGIEMIAPHRNHRKAAADQYGRRLRPYQRRWLVEHFFVWIQWQRPLLVRLEYDAENFLGFAKLATMLILFEQL